MKARRCRRCKGCGLAYPLTHRYAVPDENGWFHSKSCRKRYFAEEKDRELTDEIHKTILEKHGIDIKAMLKAVDNMTHEDCQNFIKQTTSSVIL